MQVGSFGDVVFEVSADGKVMTPSNITRESKARYEEHKVIGAYPRLEYLSPELNTMSLAIKLRADMGLSPVRVMDKLAGMCLDGKVGRLIISGVGCGKFVLESLSQVWRHTGPEGVYCIDLTLNLKEYT